MSGKKARANRREIRREFKMVPVEELANIPNVGEAAQTPTELVKWVIARMQLNVKATGHPLYHRTADDTVVDSDPTLQDWLRRLSSMLPTPASVDENFYFTPRGRAALLGEPYEDSTCKTWGYGWLRYYDDTPSGHPATTPEDIEADRKIVAEMATCTPEQYKAARELGESIVAERKYRPHEFFIVVRQTEDGQSQLLDESALDEVLKRRGIEHCPARVFTNLTNGEAAVVAAIVQGRDLSAAVN